MTPNQKEFVSVVAISLSLFGVFASFFLGMVVLLLYWMEILP